MSADKPTRVYTLGDLTVEWWAPKCIHCEACHQAMPEVFDPQRRPWVDLSKDSAERIREQVNNCPSGALVCRDTPKEPL